MDKKDLDLVKDTIFDAVYKATQADRKTTSNFWAENKVWMTEITGELKGIKEHLIRLNGKSTRSHDDIQTLNVWRGEVDLQDLSIKTYSFVSWLKGGIGIIGIVLVIGIGLITYIYKTEASQIDRRLSVIEAKFLK